MERSAIRERRFSLSIVPGFRCAPSGLHLENEQNAVRRLPPIPRCAAPAWRVDRHQPPGRLERHRKAMKQAYVRNGPAIMFNNNGTDYPLVAGVYSTRSKALLAFEADEETIFDKVLHGLDNPIPPVFAANGAPCHEEIIEGEAIDIRNFPV